MFRGLNLFRKDFAVSYKSVFRMTIQYRIPEIRKNISDLAHPCGSRYTNNVIKRIIFCEDSANGVVLVFFVQNRKQNAAAQIMGSSIVFVIARGYRYQLDIKRERPFRRPCRPRPSGSSACHRIPSPTHRRTFSKCRRTSSCQTLCRDVLSAML